MKYDIQTMQTSWSHVEAPQKNISLRMWAFRELFLAYTGGVPLWMYCAECRENRKPGFYDE